MALQSVWIEDGTGYHSYLIDPEAYTDATTQLELKWRILTGCSHQGYLAAHAGMLKRIAARLLSALEPPKYLALPAPKTARQLEHEAWLENYIAREQQHQAPKEERGSKTEKIDLARWHQLRPRTCACDCALSLLSDQDFISAMFALYAQGQPRVI